MSSSLGRCGFSHWHGISLQQTGHNNSGKMDMNLSKTYFASPSETGIAKVVSRIVRILSTVNILVSCFGSFVPLFERPALAAGNGAFSEAFRIIAGHKIHNAQFFPHQIFAFAKRALLGVLK